MEKGHKMKKYNYTKAVFIGLLLITFLYGKFQGGFVSWFLFYSILLLTLYILILSRYALRGLKIERSFSKTRLIAGDDLEITIKIFNHFGFPLSYLLIIDDQPIKMKSLHDKNKQLIYPWFRSISKIHYTVPKVTRGIHYWEKIELVTGDLFGLIQTKKIIPSFSEVMVYPKSYPIQQWHSRNVRNIGASFSQNRTNEDAASVIGVREYRTGDRFHRIHWKQSAKSMQLMTKEFERNLTNDFMFIFDQDKKKYPIEKYGLFERAVELTASLVSFAIDQRFTVGILSEGKGRKGTSLARGPEHVMKIFEILAMVEPNVDIPLEQTVLNEIPYLPYGTTIVIVTSDVGQELNHLLNELLVRKIKVEVFLVHLEENKSMSWIDIDRYKQLGIAIHLIPLSNWGEIMRNGGMSFGR